MRMTVRKVYAPGDQDYLGMTGEVTGESAHPCHPSRDMIMLRFDTGEERAFIRIALEALEEVPT